jgi:hypothetical protein
VTPPQLRRINTEHVITLSKPYGVEQLLNGMASALISRGNRQVQLQLRAERFVRGDLDSNSPRRTTSITFLNLAKSERENL